MGLSDEGKVFILVGSVRNACGTCAEFSSEELKQCKVKTTLSYHSRIGCETAIFSQPCCFSVQEESFTALQMSDSVGWAIKAEIQSSDSEANGILLHQATL